MNDVYERAARFEHRFWLQILGDHSRFIFDALAPSQTAEIEQAANFIQAFDAWLEQINTADLPQLAAEAEKEAMRLREI